MKILLCPNEIIENHFKLKVSVRNFLNKVTLGKVNKSKILINGELNHYGEITRLLTNELVHTYVDLKDIYFVDDPWIFKDIAPVDNYPSNFNLVRPKLVSSNYVNENLNSYDAILISVQSSLKSKNLALKAKRKGVIVIYFDKKDHQEVYFNKNVDIFRGVNEDNFDAFLKQDLPFNFQHKKVFPTCPIPCIDIEKSIFKEDKKYSISFIGDYKEGITLPDRKIICDFSIKSFSNSYIKYSSDKSHFHTFEAMNEIYNNSKIIISPSGIVWDSYRHADFVRYNSPVLMPRPFCQIAGKQFVDMENCILYDTNYLSGGREIIKLDELKEKINFIINNVSEQKRIYENYYKLISSSHTRVNRSQYILDLVKKISQNEL